MPLSSSTRLGWHEVTDALALAAWGGVPGERFEVGRVRGLIVPENVGAFTSFRTALGEQCWKTKTHCEVASWDGD